MDRWKHLINQGLILIQDNWSCFAETKTKTQKEGLESKKDGKKKMDLWISQ